MYSYRGDRKTIKITNTLFFNKDAKLIIFEKKELSLEDELILEFSKILNKCGIKYAVVAGYLSILFGRNRRTDDVDVIIGELGFDKFRKLCQEAFKKGFEALQVDISVEEGIKKLYEEYFLANYKPRFVKRGMLLPNIELKRVSTTLERYVLENPYSILVGGKGLINISPLELQIAYKLWLGSDKDVGDARFLYKLFEEVIDENELVEWCRKLGVDLRWLK